MRISALLFMGMASAWRGKRGIANCRHCQQDAGRRRTVQSIPRSPRLPGRGRTSVVEGRLAGRRPDRRQGGLLLEAAPQQEIQGLAPHGRVAEILAAVPALHDVPGAGIPVAARRPPAPRRRRPGPGRGWPIRRGSGRARSRRRPGCGPARRQTARRSGSPAGSACRAPARRRRARCPCRDSLRASSLRECSRRTSRPRARW